MSRRRFEFEGWGLLVAGVVLASACARHDAAPVFRRTVFIGERGISVPLPPPSILAEPEQDVDVQVEAIGTDPVLAGTVAHVEDLLGGSEDALELAAGTEAFVLEGLTIDLSANCLELWLVAPDGRESDHALVHTEIVSDSEIATVVGCD